MSTYDYNQLVEDYLQLSPPISGYASDGELEAMRPLSDCDYTDILDNFKEEASQCEVPFELLRKLFTAKPGAEACVAAINLADEIKRQAKELLLGRLYCDVSEAIEDEEVNAHFVGNL